MAKARRKSSNARGGSTLFGLLAGLMLGLAAAAAVAIFVTQVPMPFVDKASRDPARVLLPDVRDAPDPNIGLYGENRPGGTTARGPTVTPPKPLPSQPSSPSMSDEIGELLATLGAPSPDTVPPATTAPSRSPGALSPSQPSTPSKPAPAQAAPPAVAANQTTYFLQAGAFRSENDAEAIKAQILMLGLPVAVQKAQVNGATLYRVRVGPFKGIDEMNRSRVRLGEARIDSSVVRP